MAEKTVLMCMPAGTMDAMENHAFILRLAAARRWRFFSAEIESAPGASPTIRRASVPADSLATLASTLRPDGVLVYGHAVSSADLRSAIGKSVPAVFVTSDGQSDDPRASFVDRDPESIADAAARTFLFQAGGVGEFAFVPVSPDSDWSRARGEAFARRAAAAGKRFHRFDAGAGAPGDESPERPPLAVRLGRWLEALPKPCCLLAANDLVAESVLWIAAKSGIAVPDDLAVIGVDNRPHVCEATTPTLTSVKNDIQAELRVSADMLDAWLASPSAPPPPRRLVPADGVELRASTRLARDRRVAAALEFIRLHACEEGFGPRAVVASMGISRTVADKLFRTGLGRTILDEIHARRLERAKGLLLSGIAPDAVGALCGYASHQDFRRVFRNRVGTTIRRWTLSRSV